MQKGIFLPPALFANAHLLLNKLRFAAELKNKNLRFLHAVSSYAKLSFQLFYHATLGKLAMEPYQADTLPLIDLDHKRLLALAAGANVELEHYYDLLQLTTTIDKNICSSHNSFYDTQSILRYTRELQ